MSALDPRLNAFRPDLADESLRGRVEAGRFVSGRPVRVAAGHCDIRRAPSPDAPVDTQALRGDALRVFDENEGWAWVQAGFDGYTGYTASAGLGPDDPAPGHRVCVPRTFIYPGADLKFPPTGGLSLGAAVNVTGETETRGTRYAMLPSGEAVIARHLRPVGETDGDYVAVAETMLTTPYLWGGTTGFGLDCSGIVQLAMRMTGRMVLRDTDMQASSIGDAPDPGKDFGELRRGDLVFWKGHVAILTDAETVIHASGHAMLVTREPLRDAVERIRPLFGDPTGFRRP